VSPGKFCLKLCLKRSWGKLVGFPLKEPSPQNRKIFVVIVELACALVFFCVCCLGGAVVVFLALGCCGLGVRGARKYFDSADWMLTGHTDNLPNPKIFVHP